MSDYFEMNFSSKNRPRPVYHNQKRTTGALELSVQVESVKGVDLKQKYCILGIEDDLTWKYIQEVIDKKIPGVPDDLPIRYDVLGEPILPFQVVHPTSFGRDKERCSFSYKGEFIHGSNIVMAGNTDDYSPDIINFCKAPVKQDGDIVYYHYGNSSYNYYNIYVHSCKRMWKIIKEVLFNPKYCIIYIAS